MSSWKEIMIGCGLSKEEAELINNIPNSNMQNVLLVKILTTLREMKKQEFDYWEAWKKAKTAEQQIPKGVEQE